MPPIPLPQKDATEADRRLIGHPNFNFSAMPFAFLPRISSRLALLFLEIRTGKNYVQREDNHEINSRLGAGKHTQAVQSKLYKKGGLVSIEKIETVSGNGEVSGQVSNVVAVHLRQIQHTCPTRSLF